MSRGELLLEPDHAYHIALLATRDGHVQFSRDGVVIFDWHDPQPLRSGWFGFRTVHSRINGWILDERTPAAVAEALRWVLDQPLGSMSGAAVAAAQPYTAETTLQHVYDTYRHLAGVATSGKPSG